ncbi:MAG: hypothetical protein SGI77_12705 [Pirellulaceae bacterium]|nr:hypothetical protein [Pirellulaceae bacterium]
MKFEMHLMMPMLVVAMCSMLSPMNRAALGQISEDLRQNPPAPMEGTRQEAISVFLKASNDQRQRYAAGLRLASPDKAESEQLVAFAMNPQNDADLRLLAFAVHRSPKGISENILKIVREPTGERPEFVVELVDLVSRWFFVNPTSDLAREGTLALRSRLQDESPNVRIHAFESLLSNNDLRAVELATAQIKGTGNLLVPDYIAVSLLERADPKAHISLFRERFEREIKLDQPPPQTLAALVSALAIDPDLQPRLMELVGAKGTDPVVKRAGLESLSLHHAKDFPTVALNILNEANETAGVRQDAARCALRFINRGTTQEKEAYALPFGESISKVLESNPDDAAPLQNQLRKIQSSLYQQFPLIQEKLK